ncbi:hypothetical protein ACKWTF_014403 [Chironomus riparius]
MSTKRKSSQIKVLHNLNLNFKICNKSISSLSASVVEVNLQTRRFFWTSRNYFFCFGVLDLALEKFKSIQRIAAVSDFEFVNEFLCLISGEFAISDEGGLIN